MNKILPIYERLLKAYGPQGWWPLLELHYADAANKTGKGCNPTKTGSVNGYHPGDYSYPLTERQRLEICLGAILTQNTSWVQVEKALLNLDRMDALSVKGIRKLSDAKLMEAIKPSGYYNQKAKKIRIFIEFYEKLGARTPTREELLDLWGIGPETADSMLLYAYKVPVFVIDAYTRRIFSELGFFDAVVGYEDIRRQFEESLPKDAKIYQEFHALIVEHAKRMRSDAGYAVLKLR